MDSIDLTRNHLAFEWVSLASQENQMLQGVRTSEVMKAFLSSVSITMIYDVT